MSIRQNSQAFAPDGAASSGEGAGTSTTLAQALDLAVEAGADIVNISAAHCGPAITVGDPALTAGVERAVQRDVVVVVAAGNLGSGGDCSTQNTPGQRPVTGATPASIPAALTVGSVTTAGAPADFSLAGEWVDVAAPGERIISTNPHREQTGQVDSVVGAEGVVPIQGTSFSAPYVAGVAALVRARFPGLSAEAVAHRIVVTADHPAGPGERTIHVGFGTVNPRRALTAVLPEEQTAKPGRRVRATELTAAGADATDGTGRAVALAGSTGLLVLLGATLTARGARRRLRHPDQH